MEKFTVTLLFFMALALPVVLYLLLRLRSRLSGLHAAAIAISVGWAFNLAYAFIVQKVAAGDGSQFDGDIVLIAAVFGWVCPSVLVFLTWLVWRLATRRVSLSKPPQ